MPSSEAIALAKTAVPSAIKTSCDLKLTNMALIPKSPMNRLRNTRTMVVAKMKLMMYTTVDILNNSSIIINFIEQIWIGAIRLVRVPLRYKRPAANGSSALQQRSGAECFVFCAGCVLSNGDTRPLL